MQPIQYPVNLEGLTRVWQQYVDHGSIDPQIDPIVAMSWRRCRPLHNPRTAGNLPRLSAESLPSLLINHFNLIAIARPFMEDIYQFVEGSGQIVVLLDASACVLEVLGDGGMRAEAAALGMEPGTYWDEGHAGTNAFGLAMLEGSPVQVIGAEHLFERFHSLADAAAPIFNSDGHPILILGLVSRARDCESHTLGVAYAAARAIGTQIQAEQLFIEVNAQRTQLEATLEAITGGLVVIDAGGLVTDMNAIAAEILNLKYEAVVGRPLSEYVDLPSAVQESLHSQQPLNEVEVIFQVKGLQLGCLINLHPIRYEPGAGVDGWILTLRKIEQVHQLVQRMVGARATLTLTDFLGESSIVNNIRRQAQIAARSQSPILVVGETGTGKGVVARAIHNESARANGPFITINCRVLPRDIVVREFLGYEGSAIRKTGSFGQPSKFELTHGGTLHLEEIDALPLEMQTALLRVIDTGEVMRLGGTRIIPVDVRFIATTSANLERAVVNGDFRADLYYALSRIIIRLPDLRDRMSDLNLLVEAALDRLQRQTGHRIEISPEALQVLRRYRWPGNNRELENALERAANLSEYSLIEVEHLPENIRGRSGKAAQEEHMPSLHEAEYEAIMRAGWVCNGNLSKMAAMLGIGRTTLWRKMKAAGIRVEDLRKPVEVRSNRPL
jgi:transcriptional regulator of acetoin/glycerol metabolism